MSSPTRHAVVTGCAGFIGSHLSERLIGDGWHVTGVDAFTSYYDPRQKVANLNALANEPRFDLLRLDLAGEPLRGLFERRPHVFHLAAQPGVRGSFGDGFAQYVRHNINATQRVFEAAHESGINRVVYASSSSVYGDADAYPVIEGITPTRPRSPYGVTKRSCEDLGQVYRSLGLETVGLRYFTVYGPRQRPDMAMRRLCETAMGGPPFVLHGDGRQSRDFTHVYDAVSATVLAAIAPDPGSVINVGGGNEATMLEVIEIISALAGQPVDVERGPDQIGDVRRTGADTSRARRALGWRAEMDLQSGLRGQFEWVDQQHAVRTEAPDHRDLVGSHP